jgi:DUF438 domain-containing protein
LEKQVTKKYIQSFNIKKPKALKGEFVYISEDKILYSIDTHRPVTHVRPIFTWDEIDECELLRRIKLSGYRANNEMNYKQLLRKFLDEIKEMSYRKIYEFMPNSTAFFVETKYRPHISDKPRLP